MEESPAPIVIISSAYSSEASFSFNALQAGAVAVMDKPRYQQGERDSQAQEVLRTLRTMSEVKVVRRRPLMTQQESSATRGASSLSLPSGGVKVIAMGASTGGPPVIQQILTDLPRDLPAPILIVQHITSGFTSGFVQWLNQTTGMKISMAEQGETARPGQVYVAPEGVHLLLSASGALLLSASRPECGVRPSATVLFRSVATTFGKNAVGVLLTGMGRDGADGLKLMKYRGAVTIAQDQQSSLIHGMPGEAIKLGAASRILPDSRIAWYLKTVLGLDNGGSR